MDRQDVNIYIEQSIKGLKKEDGVLGYVLEYKRRSGEVETKEVYISLKDVTAHEMELTAIYEAVKRVVKPCVITIHSGHGYFKTAFQNHWIEIWQQDNWITKRGGEVKHKKKWCAILKELQKHQLIVAGKEHSYKESMLWQIKRKKEQEEKTCLKDLENLTKQKK